MRRFFRLRNPYTITIIGALPLIIFAFLRLVPDWDIHIWPTPWHYRLIYFYSTAFASFMALIASIFVGPAFHLANDSRPSITRVAFIVLSVFLLLNSINTPQILFPEIGSAPLRWSSRLSLLPGAFFFSMANIHWSRTLRQRLAKYRLALWLLGLSLYALFVALIYGFTNFSLFLAPFIPYESLIVYTISLITISLYLWAARANWQTYQKDEHIIKGRLTVTLILLAEAQLFQTFGIWGQLSWLFSSLAITIALMIALSAFLKSFYIMRDLQPARYFAVLGSIIIIGIALAGGELARWLTEGVQRRFIISLTLIQGTVSFLLLYIIVLRLDRLINERTNALKREQKLRSDLTRLIVHDLKNPLTIMTQGARLLNKGRVGELTDQQKGLTLRMENAGAKTLGLIEDLLNVERLEANKILLHKTPLDVWRILTDSVAEFQILTEANQQTLTLRLTTRLPILAADNNLIRRVFDNIISNAIKFSPEGGRIEVSAWCDDSYLAVTVADSGPGIHPAHRDLVFEKFSQLHASERRGAGLGLTFCKMAVEAHEGTISIEDSSLGGTLFKITLPLDLNLPLKDSPEISKMDAQRRLPPLPARPLQTNGL